MSHLRGTGILEIPSASSTIRTRQAGDAVRPLVLRSMDHCGDLLPTIRARAPWTGIVAQTLGAQLQYRRRHFKSVRSELPTPPAPVVLIDHSAVARIWRAQDGAERR